MTQSMNLKHSQESISQRSPTFLETTGVSKVVWVSCAASNLQLSDQRFFKRFLQLMQFEELVSSTAQPLAKSGRLAIWQSG
jgi:uncharacterized membrane protein